MKKGQRTFKYALMTIAAIAIIIVSFIVYGFTYGYKKLVKEEFTYSHPLIPSSFDGYRIIHISDLHVGTFSNNMDVVNDFITKINNEKADLIVFTGDLVNRNPSELKASKASLSKLAATDGVISVMGNHDYLFYYPWANERERIENVRKLQALQREMGWNLLLNSNTRIHRSADSIAIIGVENDGKPPFPALGDLNAAQKGTEDGTFKILLSHDPSHWRRKVLPETKIPLTLSGHTHAMQMKFFGFSPSQWLYPEWSGEYREGTQTLIVSEGLGEVLVHFRLGAWPQYSVITLKQEQP